MPVPAMNQNINLVTHDGLEESPYGRLLTWATTYGRYIMITTEIVVLLAFISRFSLDRKITDLNEAIAQKKMIIQANQDFENEIKSIQSKISTIKSLLPEQETSVQSLLKFKSYLPFDVYIESFIFSSKNINTDVIAQTTNGFMQFIRNLQSQDMYSKIEIGEISRNPDKGLEFKMTFTLKDKTPVKNAPNKKEVPVD